MANKKIPPTSQGEPFESDNWQQFFVLVRQAINQPTFTAVAVDPDVFDIPSGSYAVWKNTTTGVVRLWVNDGNTLKGTTLT